VFQTDGYYILKKAGEEGLKKIEEKAQKLGVSIPYRKTSALDWYPAGLRAISLLLIKETFKLNNKEIRNIGYTAPKVSLIVKLLMKFFVSPKKFVEKIPHYWRQHWTVGELQVVEFDSDNKKLVLRLKGINLSPIFCLYEEGYFQKMWEFVMGKAKCKETKCTFKGNRYHEYILKGE